MERESNLRLGSPIEKNRIPKTMKTKPSIYRPLLEEVLKRVPELRDQAVPVLGFDNITNAIHGLNRTIKAMNIDNIKARKRDDKIFLIVE